MGWEGLSGWDGVACFKASVEGLVNETSRLFYVPHVLQDLTHTLLPSLPHLPSVLSVSSISPLMVLFPDIPPTLATFFLSFFYVTLAALPTAAALLLIFLHPEPYGWSRGRK